jgi:hypothetical protein
MKNRLPKLKYPPIHNDENKKKQENSHQLLSMLLTMDNATFEKVYPKTEQLHEN